MTDRQRTPRPGRGAGGWLSSALAGAVLRGGGALGRGARVRRARCVADHVYPGLLTVVGTRSLFPQTSGTEVAFALADDADAVARLRVAGPADRPGLVPPEDDPLADDLRRAVAAARQDAAWLRALTAAFEAGGHEVLAVDERLARPWIAARPTNATVDAVLAGVGACVARWSADRAGHPRAAGVRTVTVALADPAAARRLPVAGRELPGLSALTGPRRAAALSARPYLAATYRLAESGHAGGPVEGPAREGPAGIRSPHEGAPGEGPAGEDPMGATPALAETRVVRPLAERAEFERNIVDVTLPLVRAAYPHAVPSMSPVMGGWPLRPGTVDELRGHVLLCERPSPDGRHGLGDLAAEVTTDLSGTTARDLRVHTAIRDARGVLCLPAVEHPAP